MLLCTFVGTAWAQTIDPNYYYRIKNVVRTSFYMTSDGSYVWMNEGNEGNLNQYWKIEEGTGENVGKYAIRTVDGKYMHHNPSKSQHWSVSDTEEFLAINNAPGVAVTEGNVVIGPKDLDPSTADDSDTYKVFAHDANNGTNKLVSWGPSAGASRWILEKTNIAPTATPVTVNYSFKYEGTEKATQSVRTFIGLSYPDITVQLPFGVTATKPAGTVADEDGDGAVSAEITLTNSLKFADSYANVSTWYYLKFHANDQNYLYYDGELTYLDASKSSYDVDVNDIDAYSWAFVGNPFDGFKVVNKKAGSSKVLISAEPTTSGNDGDDQRTYPVMGDGDQLWKLTKSTYGTDGFFMALGNTGKRLNKRDGKVAYWLNGADAGSTFTVQEADLSFFVNRVFGLAPFDILEGSTVQGPSEFDNPAQINNDIAASEAVEDNLDAKKAFYLSEPGQRLLKYVKNVATYGSLANIQVEMKAEYGTLIMPCPSEKVTGLKRKTLANTDIDANGVINLDGLAEGTFDQNVPYLIQATEGSKFTIIGWDKGSKATHTSGLLTGVLNETTKVPAGSYILSKYNDKLGFYKVGTDADYDAAVNRCYLTLSAGNGARFEALFFDANDATGINGVTEGQAKQSGIFNIAGQRLNKLQKGLNIVNGKKIIVK